MFYLQLKNELWKLFGKKRTYIGFGTFLIAQNVMLMLFHSTKVHRFYERALENNGYLTDQYISALSVALVMLIPQIIFLMPLYACLIGGDLVAKEAEDGTLRMILCRPVSRLRLLFLKWCAGIIFSIVLVLALGGMAVLFARMWFPWKDMFVYFPEEQIFNILTVGHGLKLYIYSHLFLAINAATMMSIAFAFSCFNMKPATATVLGVSILLICLVLEHIPSLADYRPYMLLYHFRAWLVIYSNPIDWARIFESLCVLIGFNVTCFIAGTTAFQVRDFKS